MNKTKISIPFFIVVVVSGCAETQEPGIVAQEWAKNTRQLNIFPLFPPRERFYPGDVYIFPFVSPKMTEKVPSKFYTIKPIRFTRFDVSDILEKEQTIPTMPQTKDWESLGSAESRAGAFVSYPSTDSRQNGVIAFPGYSFASVSDVSLGLGTVTSAIAQTFSFASSSKRNITFSVPYAEVISMDISSSMDKFLLYKASVDKNETSKLQYLEGQMQLLIDNLLDGSKNKYGISPGIVFVTDVYYARSINVTITSANGVSASESATLAKLTTLTTKRQTLVDKLNELKSQNKTLSPKPASNGAATPDQTKTEQDSSVGAVSSNINTAEIDSLASEINALDIQLKTLSQSILPDTLGFTGSITRASGNSVTLKQVFKYPVAIGYNGITMPVQSFIKMKINIIPYQENTLNTETNRVGTNVATTKIKVTTDWTELLKNNITSPNLITTPLNQVRYGSEEGLGILEK
ncbi:hypothetical protein JNS61_25270 [Klebsiella pneumoniae]|nr:hypothetical protein [Klebsiella pneumoniae]MBL9363361.1 hypothetical protein [Klebsiella pneumoniae]MBL9419184.1 hypothetical protein [Klebsiella pneumoniae]MBL9780928.1 hypothetical protein [Klebsiella pneumoniae]MBL9786463.1 hypothetical protein [Klebsiella pneumoniae]